MSLIATTPEPPYYAVIFTSERTGTDEGYADTALRMLTLAAEQPGYLGVESAREGLGITVSYWRDLASIQSWKRNADHVEAQKRGRDQWYSAFTCRIAHVKREYSL
ncbi:antibiotic biosynthesis monooxygenase family protein [Halioglobus pacificus]|uniref:ABM domain-containing protein n=1 Tax=Parahalioglobus pacificus TaxID=930806 RepID=A0A918XF96_9GAMM|nr:antibiotic biosynthesis monooxygenase [Halioglobus pacificus]GHD28230.1 hypothetical protein GCM10007053_07410 [Halioglobus pacificus]